jgi:hypothetical protein
MAEFVFNIAKGRVVELYNRVKSNDPANSALIIVPLEATGLEADAVLMDKDTLADLLSGTTNEQTDMGRITLTDADLASLPAPDDSGNLRELSLPSALWALADGNNVGKLAICYDPDTTGGTDSAIIPLTAFDFVISPTGANVSMTGGVFFRATEPA